MEIIMITEGRTGRVHSVARAVVLSTASAHRSAHVLPRGGRWMLVCFLQKLGCALFLFPGASGDLSLGGENGMLKKEFRLTKCAHTRSRPVPWLCKCQSSGGKWLGPSVPCPKPPLCSVPGMCGGVGLNMDPHGRSRLPGVLVQRGLRQHGAGRRLGQEGQSWERRTVAFVG